MLIDDHLRPPCWEPGQTCPNACARAHYERVVYNHAPLYGPWAGWRLAGRELVSPGRSKAALRIPPVRLLGLLWREAEAAKLTTAHAKSGHRGEVVELVPKPNR